MNTHSHAIGILRERCIFYQDKINKQTTRRNPDDQLIKAWRSMIDELRISITTLDNLRHTHQS